MLTKIHMYAVDGLENTLAGTAAQTTNQLAAIAVIEGNDTTEGSISYSSKATKAYIDSLVANVDLSQVQNNKDALIVLNSDDTTDGSLAKSIKTPTDLVTGRLDAAQTVTETNTSDIAVLNSSKDTAGSVSAKIASLVGLAPESMDTLKEIADIIGDNTSHSDALLVVINNNKSAVDGSVTSLDEAIAAVATTIATLNGDNTVDGSVDKSIETALTGIKTQMNAAHLNVADNLSDIAKKGAVLNNLDILDKALAEAVCKSFQGECRRPMVTVTDSGTIVLPEYVSQVDLISVRHKFAGGVSDNLQVTAVADQPGTYKCYVFAENDLNGVGVEVHFFAPKTV